MTYDTPQIGIDPPEAFYTQLGHFVTKFGFAEAVLKRLLARTVGLDDPTNLAVFSGTRAAEVTSLIRRCHEARGEALSPDIEAILQQFIVLNNLRNDLLHHGIDFTSDPPVTTNAKSVLNVKAVRASIILDGTLSAASADCSRIALGVAILLLAKWGVSEPEIEEVFSSAVQTPWHYIPRAPANKGRQDRQRQEPHRSGKPPPRSSQG